MENFKLKNQPNRSVKTQFKSHNVKINNYGTKFNQSIKQPKRLKLKKNKSQKNYKIRTKNFRADNHIPGKNQKTISSFNQPQELMNNSKDRIKNITLKNQFQRALKNKTKADTSDFENEGLGSHNLKQAYNFNIENAYYGTKISKKVYQSYSEQRNQHIEHANQRSRNLKSKTEKSDRTKQKNSSANKHMKKKQKQKEVKSFSEQRTQIKESFITWIKNTSKRVVQSVQSLFSAKNILIALGIALLIAIFLFVLVVFNGLFVQSSESSYVFTAQEATQIDKAFTEKEIDYAIELQKKINQADGDTIINFESIGHEPHELLALVNIMILPEYIANKGKISQSTIEQAINTIFEARYQFEEREETYTVETELGRKIKKTRRYLTSNTESFDNIVSGSSGDIPANTRDFLDRIGDDASEIAHENGLYASVMLAQAILETGSGSSDLSSPPYYNLFGIKGSYQGETVYMKTNEDDGTGNQYTITDGFRDYPSYRESMEDYAYVMKNQPSPGFYSPTWKANTNSYRDATAYLQGTYATDTAYASKLNRIIEAYDLTKYDTYTYSIKDKANHDKLEEKLEAENTTRTLTDLKEGRALSFTNYEQELYRKQKEARGLMGTYPSLFEEDWSPKLIKQFGFNWNKDQNRKEKSDNIQLNADSGTNILAQLPGKVTRIYRKNDMLSIEIKSKDTLTFQYENLDTVYVSENDTVSRGDIIGTTTSTPLVLKTENKKGKQLNPQIMMATENPKVIMHTFTTSGHYSDPSSLDKRMSNKTYDDQAVQRLFDTAKKYMGMPYVFGGKTPQSSFDCSGLVVWVYTESGFRPMNPEGAQGIYDKYTVPISKEEARPGDLVFFERTYNAPTRITHVGIYAGNDVMFHAGDPIGFARIDNPYWASKSPQFARVID